MQTWWYEHKLAGDINTRFYCRFWVRLVFRDGAQWQRIWMSLVQILSPSNWIGAPIQNDLYILTLKPCETGSVPRCGNPHSHMYTNHKSPKQEPLALPTQTTHHFRVGTPIWYWLPFRSVSGQRCSVIWRFNVKKHLTPPKLHFFLKKDIFCNFGDSGACTFKLTHVQILTLNKHFLGKNVHFFGQKHPFYTYKNALFPPLSPKGP